MHAAVAFAVVALAASGSLAQHTASSRSTRAPATTAPAPPPPPVAPSKPAPLPRTPTVVYSTYVPGVGFVSPLRGTGYYGPYYRPIYPYYGAYDLAALAQARATAMEQQNAEVRQALDDLQYQIDVLQTQQAVPPGYGAMAAQQDASRAALARLIQGEDASAPSRPSLEKQQRAAWPRWMEHWEKTGPTIAVAAVKLKAAASQGKPAPGCVDFLAFNDELRVAIPPAPGNVIDGLHSGLYEARAQCLSGRGNAEAVAQKAENLRGAVEQLSEWAAGRSADYAAAP